MCVHENLPDYQTREICNKSQQNWDNTNPLMFLRKRKINNKSQQTSNDVSLFHHENRQQKTTT